MAARLRAMYHDMLTPVFFSTADDDDDADGHSKDGVKRQPRQRSKAFFADTRAQLREHDAIRVASLQLTYRIDVNGWWPEDFVEPQQQQHDDDDVDDAKKRDREPPEWSLVVDARDTDITYGPWADRQRAIISQFFFPRDYESLKFAPRKAGQRREYEMFDISVSFKNKFNMRMPFRVPTLAAEDGAKLDVDRDMGNDIHALTVSGSDVSVRYLAPMYLCDRQRNTCRTDLMLRTTQPLNVSTSRRGEDAPLLRANALVLKLAMHEQAIWNDEVILILLYLKKKNHFVLVCFIFRMFDLDF